MDRYLIDGIDEQCCCDEVKTLNPNNINDNTINNKSRYLLRVSSSISTIDSAVSKTGTNEASSSTHGCVSLRKTCLLLPTDSYSSSNTNQSDLYNFVECHGSGEEDGNPTKIETYDTITEVQDPIPSATMVMLPEQEKSPSSSSRCSHGVDEWLNTYPIVRQRCQELLSQNVVELNSTTTDMIIYAGQREIAHTNSMNAILVSDRATTCHILILRSRTIQQAPSASSPLCTVAHLDGCTYTDCIRSTLYRHRDYHRTTNTETMSSTKIIKNNDDKIIIDVHIVGGFIDTKQSNTSREISNWLLHLLADIAFELLSDNVILTLQTLAISLMNTIEDRIPISSSYRDEDDELDDDNDNDYIDDDETQCKRSYSPIGRGLAIDCNTGRVFLAKCTRDVMGPAVTVRHVRLWSSSSTGNNNDTRLLEISNGYNGNHIVIPQFRYGPSLYLQDLMRLPDRILIQACSTSPHCEEDDFCSTVRETVHFLSTIPWTQVFNGSIFRNNNNNYDTEVGTGTVTKIHRKSRNILFRKRDREHSLAGHDASSVAREHVLPSNALVFQRCHSPINSWRLVSP